MASDHDIHFTLHFTAYLIPLLILGLAPLLPTPAQGIPLPISCMFNIVIAHLKPTPNADQIFTFFHWFTWVIAGVELVALRE
jgi:hypothetical protein